MNTQFTLLGNAIAFPNPISEEKQMAFSETGSCGSAAKQFKHSTKAQLNHVNKDQNQLLVGYHRRSYPSPT
jgi:hypothetical protein